MSKKNGNKELVYSLDLCMGLTEIIKGKNYG